MAGLSEVCTRLEHVNYWNFVFSLFILLGILISYLPQHVRIINRRSSYGLSPYFVLLGTVSGTCQFANILSLPGSRADMACCRDVNGFACFAGLLGVFQVGMQWACFTVIMLLFLIFFPRATPETLDPVKDADKTPSYRTAVSVVVVCVVHAVITAIISLYVSVAAIDHLQAWANFLGILSTVLAAIQYLPQIYTTYQLKRVASLSIPMMCIQTPGGIIWAVSLATRLGIEGWSAWGVYVVTACFQGTLLILGVYYELQHRKKKREEQEQSQNETSEETPLLRS